MADEGGRKRTKTLVLAEQKGCSRAFYHLGKKSLKLPGVRSAVHLMTPARISELGEGAIEETCCAVCVVLFILIGTFIGFFTFGFQQCSDIQYLSLDSNSKNCDPVPIAISSTNYFDDKGIWDTSSDWAFGNTMCSVEFIGYETSNEDWQDKYAPELYQTYRDWNEEWKSNIVIDNLIAMVVSEKPLDGSTGFMLANVLADPVSLMDGDMEFSVAVNYDSDPVLDLNSTLYFGLTFEDGGNTFSLSAPKSKWTETYPNWNFPSQDDGDDYYDDDDDYFDDDAQSDPTLDVSLNKYSVWVAAAVNMGIININQLTNIANSSYSKQFLDRDNLYYDDGGGSVDYSGDDDLLSPNDLNNYVLIKYYKKMDPIRCTHLKTRQYCWVTTGTPPLDQDDDDDDDTRNGALLFPLFQHWDHTCVACHEIDGLYDDDYDEKWCNNLDLIYLFYFNPDTPYLPHFVDFDTTQKPRHYFDPANNSAGLDGLIYTNIYSGIEYLNSFFYELPDVHCTMPIAIAVNNESKGNNLACGSANQHLQIKSDVKEIKKKAEEKYCGKTPHSVQEKFYTCKNTEISCVSASMAEAQGYTAITNLLLMTLLTSMMIAFRTKDNSNETNKNTAEDDIEMHHVNRFSMENVRNSAILQPTTMTTQGRARSSSSSSDPNEMNKLKNDIRELMAQNKQNIVEQENMKEMIEKLKEMLAESSHSTRI